MLSFLCTTSPRKLPCKQKSDTLSFLSPANKSHDIIIDSYGENCHRASQNIRSVCETDPHPASDVAWKSYLQMRRNASQKLFYLFVLLQELPSVYGRKYKLTSGSQPPVHMGNTRRMVMQQPPHGNFYSVGRTYSSFMRGSRLCSQ